MEDYHENCVDDFEVLFNNTQTDERTASEHLKRIM